MSHSLARVQLRPTKKLAKNEGGIHFNCKTSSLQSWDEDLCLKQVPCPPFREFLPCIIVQVRVSVTLHLDGAIFVFKNQSPYSSIQGQRVKSKVYLYDRFFLLKAVSVIVSCNIVLSSNLNLSQV